MAKPKITLRIRIITSPKTSSEGTGFILLTATEQIPKAPIKSWKV